MENNKTTEELTTEELSEALQNWYKAKVKSKLLQKESWMYINIQPKFRVELR